MNDNLDSLPDAQLDELFAVEICGFHYVDYTRRCYREKPTELLNALQGGFNLPPFCASADSVLSFLEKYGDADITYTKHCGNARYVVSVRRDSRAVDSKLARAIVLCLLRARRAEKGAQP